MAVTIAYEENDVCVLHVSGIWKRSEWDRVQTEVAQKITAGARPRILAILEDFEGWERGVDWNELDFLFAHSDKVERIAIVGDQRSEMHALAFAGAGVRRAPVKFFLSNELVDARTWLTA